VTAGPRLVLQTSFLGDVVLTTPLLTWLARSGPVDIVTTAAAAPLLAGHGAVRTVIAYDKRGADRGLLGLRRIAARVAAGDQHAVAYCAQGSLRTAMLAMLAGFKSRVGFDTSTGRWLYTKRVPYRREQHHAERLLRLAVGDAAVSPSDLQPSLFPSASDRLAVDELLSRHDASAEPLIALAPGSVWGTKRWPRFPDLAAALSGFARVVVVGGAADSALARDILGRVPSAIDGTGRLTILQSAELIRRATVLVTNDSLPQHLASAMRTPTVTIFGPTVPAFGFGPLAPGSVAVGHETLDCRPCHPHGPPQCPLGHHRCMRDLHEAVVLERALALLTA
jgi:heptosyltransferase-2